MQVPNNFSIIAESLTPALVIHTIECLIRATMIIESIEGGDTPSLADDFFDNDPLHANCMAQIVHMFVCSVRAAEPMFLRTLSRDFEGTRRNKWRCFFVGYSVQKQGGTQYHYIWKG